MQTTTIEEIAGFFRIPGRLIKAERFGSGLINDTYLCEFETESRVRKFILQRINAGVFRNPGQVMENIAVVTSHMAERLRAAGVQEPGARMPDLVQTREGSSCRQDGSGGVWRMFHFIESGTVFDTVRDRKHAHEVGRALGRFQSLLSDLAPGRLHDTLPGFHHTGRYLAEYDEALRLDPQARALDADQETYFVEARRGLAPLLTDAMTSGTVPVRVVHNDPKVNNVMIDRETGEALCMLDLDTVKPGIVHFDFGDCVRSAANPLGEDAADISAVKLDMDLFGAIARGYLSEARTFLTAAETRLLALSVKVITFELGVRFLADHLRGDTYFKIKYPGHNLHRCRVQFNLLTSVEQAEDRMAALIRELAGPER